MTSILAENPVLVKHGDGSLSCSFKIQYTTLRLSIPNQGTAAYSPRVYLRCEEGTFGKLEGSHLRFDTDQDPPPTDIIAGTVSLVPPGTSPISMKYVTLGLIIEEYRTGMIQEQDEYIFGDVSVPS